MSRLERSVVYLGLLFLVIGARCLVAFVETVDLARQVIKFRRR